jgi:hypothetical protein
MGRNEIKPPLTNKMELGKQLPSREKGESNKGDRSFTDNVKKYVGIGFAAMLGIAGSVAVIQRMGGLEGCSLTSESTALALKGSDKSTGLAPAFPEQRVLSTSSYSLPDSIHPDFSKHIEAYQQRVDNPPFHYGPPQEVQEPSGVRSRKMTPGEKKIAQSATDTHLDQLKQDKSERAESSEKMEKIWQFLNTKEMKESLEKLAQNETAVKLLDKATSNDKFMAGLNDFLQNDQAKEALKAMMESEGFKELAVSQLKDEASVRRALKAVANKTLTNECYKAYRNFLSYQECCRDQSSIPHCDKNFRTDWKHTGILAAPFAAAGALALCCGCYCAIKACCSKDDSSANGYACCAGFCCGMGARCCAGACEICITAVLCGGDS